MVMVVFACPDITIVDNFLSVEAFGAIIDYATVDDYHFVHQGGKWSPSWRIRDGLPLRGSTRFYPQNFPTQTALDEFVRCLALSASFPSQSISLTPWIYPQDTGLSVHTDGGGVYSGAFVFFLNRQWNIHDGGLLVVMDERTKIQGLKPISVGSQTKYLRAWLDETFEEKMIEEPGLGLTILPKPNRLVLLNSTTPHLVTKNLSSKPRLTLSGFFHL